MGKKSDNMVGQTINNLADLPGVKRCTVDKLNNNNGRSVKMGASDSERAEIERELAQAHKRFGLVRVLANSDKFEYELRQNESGNLVCARMRAVVPGYGRINRVEMGGAIQTYEDAVRATSEKWREYARERYAGLPADKLSALRAQKREHIRELREAERQKTLGE